MRALYIISIIALVIASTALVGLLGRYLRFIQRRIPGLMSSYLLMSLILLSLILSMAALLTSIESAVEVIESLLIAFEVIGSTLCGTIIIVLMGGRSKRMRLLVGLLYIVPACTFIIALTNPVTHFIVRSVTRHADGYGFEVAFALGSTIVRSGGFVTVAIALLYVVYSMKRQAGRGKVLLWLLIVTIFIPQVFGAILNAIPYLHPMHIEALASFASVVVLMYVFYGYLHTARDMAVLNTRDGYVVFDRFGQCVDINGRARKFFEDYASTPQPTFSDLAKLIGAEGAAVLATSEFELGQRASKKYFLLTNFRISNTASRYAGDGFLIREVTEFKAEVDKLNVLANQDPLTGIKNRRYFDENIGALLVPGKSFSLMILDIDFFKNVNDTFGHRVGDEVLYQLCLRCTHTLRPNDMFCRLGGEEFAIFVANKQLSTGLELAKRIFKIIADDPFTTSAGNLPVTVSIGCYSAVVDPTDTPETWVEAADKLLYQAKSNGRSRIECNA